MSYDDLNLNNIYYFIFTRELQFLIVLNFYYFMLKLKIYTGYLKIGAWRRPPGKPSFKLSTVNKSYKWSPITPIIMTLFQKYHYPERYYKKIINDYTKYKSSPGLPSILKQSSSLSYLKQLNRFSSLTSQVDDPNNIETDINLYTHINQIKYQLLKFL